MQARNIKVGQQYLASLDSSSERTLVTVVDKYRLQRTTMSGAGGYPSMHVSIRTAFNVRDDAGQISKAVEARDLFALPERPEQGASLCPYSHSFCYIDQPCSHCTDS